MRWRIKIDRFPGWHHFFFSWSVIYLSRKFFSSRLEAGSTVGPASSRPKLSWIAIPWSVIPRSVISWLVISWSAIFWSAISWSVISWSVISWSVIFIIFYPMSAQSSAQSTVIWQVGKSDGSCGEFVSPGEEIGIIHYQVPEDWESRLLDQDSISSWGEFPSSLYPPDDVSNNPHEIRIDFHYLKYYSNPVLTIVTSASSRNTSQYLAVLKGEGETLIDRRLIELPYYTFYQFPLGNIQKGPSCKENTIIIRNLPNPENSLSSSPILFDAVYLDDNDSDGDGISDSDEGGGDWDQDGIIDSLDKDTVCVPIKSDDPSVMKRIRLNVKGSGEESSPSFSEARFLDPNSLSVPGIPGVPGWLVSGRCLPYGFLGFKIENVGPQGEIIVRMGCEGDRIYPSARLHTWDANILVQESSFPPAGSRLHSGAGFQPAKTFLDSYTREANTRHANTSQANNWQEAAYKISDDGYAVSITLRDGDTGDSDGKKDGMITTCLALSYPRSLGLKVEKGGCFIETVIGALIIYSATT